MFPLFLTFTCQSDATPHPTNLDDTDCLPHGFFDDARDNFHVCFELFFGFIFQRLHCSPPLPVLIPLQLQPILIVLAPQPTPILLCLR